MGTDHYAEAERLVAGLTRDGMTIGDLTVTMAAGQVHATLATVQRGEFEKAAFTDTRTIPWPPSGEAVERVASEVHDRYCPCDGYDLEHYEDIVRAVLDAIEADDA